MPPSKLFEKTATAPDYLAESHTADFPVARSEFAGHAQCPAGRGCQDNETSLSALTKAEIADQVREQVGLNKREAKEFVESFFAEINNALERGESVKLTAFGNFQVRDKVSRPGRNLKTGATVEIPPHRVVTFHPGQKLKDIVELLLPPRATGPTDKLIG